MNPWLRPSWLLRREFLASCLIGVLAGVVVATFHVEVMDKWTGIKSWATVIAAGFLYLCCCPVIGCLIDVRPLALYPRTDLLTEERVWSCKRDRLSERPEYRAVCWLFFWAENFRADDRLHIGCCTMTDLVRPPGVRSGACSSAGSSAWALPEGRRRAAPVGTGCPVAHYPRSRYLIVGPRLEGAVAAGLGREACFQRPARARALAASAPLKWPPKSSGRYR